MSAGLGTGVRSRLSVIIPAYNYAHFLPACLASVLSQTQVDIEVLVVDDGSLDDTRAVVAATPGVRYIHQANQGLSAARNTGLAHCSGEYLLFLDADDLLAPASLAARLEYLRAHRATGLGVCRTRQFQHCDAAGHPQGGAWWLLPGGDLDLRLMYFNIAPPHAWLLHRSVADAVGWFDTGLRACEDYDYWLRALGQGHQPLYSPAGVVYYRKHGASMSADNAKQWHHDVLLHERLFDALRRRLWHPRDPRCALLAALAGAWTTLTRLPGAGHDDYERLLRGLDEDKDLSALAASPGTTTRPVLRDYYLLKLLEAGTRCAARDPRAATMFAALRGALCAAGIAAGPSRLGRALGVASHLCRDGQAPWVDRYRVARLLLSS